MDDITSSALRWIRYNHPAKFLKISKDKSELWNIKFKILPAQFGYRNQCRSSFVNKYKLQLAKERSERAMEGLEASSSTSADCGQPGTSSSGTEPANEPVRITRSQITAGGLQTECVICTKVTLYYKHAGKSYAEKLTSCETFNLLIIPEITFVLI